MFIKVTYHPIYQYWKAEAYKKFLFFKFKTGKRGFGNTEDMAIEALLES